MNIMGLGVQSRSIRLSFVGSRSDRVPSFLGSGTHMSLFNQTVARVAELEAELEKLRKKPAPKVNIPVNEKVSLPPKAQSYSYYKPYGWELPRRFSGNELSNDEIEQQFKMYEEAKVDAPVQVRLQASFSGGSVMGWLLGKFAK